MRTTIDLPDELLKRAKIAAVERGSTLRDIVVCGLRRELTATPPATSARRRALPSVRVVEGAPVLRLKARALSAAATRLTAEDDFDRAG